MPRDAVKKATDIIIGRGLITAETVASELRGRLLNRIVEGGVSFNEAQMLDLARKILAEFEPLLAETLFDTEIASWVSGVAYVADKLPPVVERQIVFINDRGGGNKPPSIIDIFRSAGGGDEPMAKFPLIERAAQSLANRNIVTPAQFRKLAADVKQQSFTVAKIDNVDTLAKIRDTLAEVVREGPSLREFRERVKDSLETSAIGAGHLENVYRTNVQTAYSVGHDSLAYNPVVAAVFPYQEYLPIDDARVRPEHLMLGHLGLSGTGIYRLDDPFWEVFTPPIDYQCRCGRNLLTVDAAARKGVREAIEWLASGKPPVEKEWRLDAIPFRPRAGFGKRPTIKAA